MRIFDETKSYEIFNPDLEHGYLRIDNMVVKSPPYQPRVAEIGHYETIATYANGGKDVSWVVDVEGRAEREAYDEIEEIQVYVPYTEKQLAERKIAKLKEMLADTDYQAIKFAEGIIAESEYAPMRAERQEWRAEINYLQTMYGI